MFGNSFFAQIFKLYVYQTYSLTFKHNKIFALPNEFAKIQTLLTFRTLLDYQLISTPHYELRYVNIPCLKIYITKLLRKSNPLF